MATRRLEVIWVTIPFLDGHRARDLRLDRARRSRGQAAPTSWIVNVTGQQFTEHRLSAARRSTPPRWCCPKDRPVTFRINTKDVLHSFWVPEFRLKSDAVPGLTTEIGLTPDQIGQYQVVCAELCGIGHSTMRQNLRVMPPPSWTPGSPKKRAASAPAGGGGGGGQAGGGGGGGADGAQVFASNGCGSCHTLSVAQATGTVGPDLGKRQADRLLHPAVDRRSRTRSSRRDSSLTSCPRTSATSCRPTNSTRSWSTF